MIERRNKEKGRGEKNGKDEVKRKVERIKKKK